MRGHVCYPPRQGHRPRRGGQSRGGLSGGLEKMWEMVEWGRLAGCCLPRPRPSVPLQVNLSITLFQIISPPPIWGAVPPSGGRPPETEGAAFEGGLDRPYGKMGGVGRRRRVHQMNPSSSGTTM